MTGTITELFSTMVPTSLTAGFSSIATASIAPADFMVAISPAGEVSAGCSMDSVAPIPAHLAVLIVEESREASRPVGNRALAEDSTVEVSEVEVSTVAEAVVANPV